MVICIGMINLNLGAILALLFLQVAASFHSGVRASSHSSGRGAVLSLSTSTETTGTSHRDFTFIRAEKGDMKQIAEMLSAAFDNKPNALVRWYSVWNYEEQLKERLVRLVEMGKEHSMLIASKRKVASLSNVDEAEVPHHMCGFIELGLLPLPKERVVTTTFEEENKNEELSALLEGRDKLPTIGNLVVEESWRNKGVGTAMLDEAAKIARDWGFPVVICAVNPDNTPAVKLYEKNGFRCAFVAKTTVQINVVQSQQDLLIMSKAV